MINIQPNLRIMYSQIDDNITKVNCYLLSSKYGNNKVFGQPKSVKTIAVIEIHSNSGFIGFGETYSGIYLPELIPSIVNSLSPLILNKKIGEINLLKYIDDLPFVANSGLLQSIKSAIDVAIWDLRSKILKKPLYELFEKKNKPIKTYASGGSVIFKPNEIVQDLEKIIAQGFDSYKMRVGYYNIKEDTDRVKIARQTLGSNKKLMIDFIMGTLPNKYNYNNVSKLINTFKNYDIDWFEEPFSPNNINDLIKLTKKTTQKIAAGEAYSGKLIFNMLILLKAVDIIQFDVTHSGGYTDIIETSKIAKSNKIETAIHVWGSSIALASNAHLFLSIDNCKILEVPTVNLELSDWLWTEKPFLKNGKLHLSNSPGIGINITKKIKEKFKYVKGSGYKI